MIHINTRFTPVFAIFFCLILPIFTFGQSVSQTNASLEDATIYGKGASLHHTTNQIAIAKGDSEIVINEISQQVDPQSIRVLSSNTEITILSVSFERDYMVDGENKSSQFTELKNNYEEAKNVLDEMSNARKAEESALGLLEANKNFGGQSGVTPASMMAMIKYYREEYKKLSSNIIVLKEKEQEQQQKVDKLKKQMNEAGGDGQNAGQLVVRLNSDQALNTKFDIYYFTPYVSWTPFYEVRVDNLNKPVQLVYKANVSQTTGIDWKQIKLSFSSGNPIKNNNAPILNPWWIGFQKTDNFGYKLQGKVAGVQMESLVVKAEDGNRDMAVVEENQLTTSFVVSTPYDIYSNQKPQAVQLKQYELPATYSYFTAPRLDSSAFLVAKIFDWQKYNLLPGEANLIIDNNFAGSSYINPNSTEDSLTLSLGRDERIITKRERIDEEGSTSFFGKSQKRIYTYEISVRNSRKEAVTIDVKEQFPLSTEKDIEIKLLETSGAQVNDDKGELTWNIHLKSGETKKVRVSYSVKMPKDKKVSGI